MDDAVAATPRPPVVVAPRRRGLGGFLLPLAAVGRRRQQRQRQTKRWSINAIGKHHADERQDEAETVADDSTVTVVSSAVEVQGGGCLKIRTQHESLLNYVGMTGPSSPTEEWKKGKSVQFSDVTINVHSIVLGDNPSVTSGPPISISWEAHASSRFNLDAYETWRPSPPRLQSELHLPPSVREGWLLDEGYARREIANATRRVYRERQVRAASVAKEMQRKRLATVFQLLHSAAGEGDGAELEEGY